MYIFKTLSNGIRVVAEKIDYLRSVSIGVWIGNGSRHEKKEENGMSHFIEHMLFKGTEHRTAFEIAGEIDKLGGQINAFTAREYTCFYTKTLSSHAPVAVDVLSDMLFCPALKEENIDLERGVILEEINMYEDSPEDLVYDLLWRTAWGDTSMGRSILGSRESLMNITSKTMREYMRTHYTSKNMIIAVSGCIDDDFFDLLEEKFGTQKLIDDEVYMYPSPYIGGGRSVIQKDIEQVQLEMGFKSIDIMDEASYSLLVFNNVFGAGMSCRLFQNIREKLGLVYSVSAGHSAYINTGIFDISAAANAKNLPKVWELICKEINTIKRDKLTRDEVASSKEQLKGSYILSAESTGARMQSAGRSLILNKPLCTEDEILAKIDAVSAESVADIIDRIFDFSNLSVAAVGPLHDTGEFM